MPSHTSTIESSTYTFALIKRNISRSVGAAASELSLRCLRQSLDLRYSVGAEIVTSKG